MGRSVETYFAELAARDGTALRDCRSPARSIDSADLLDMLDRMAAALAALGIEQGNKVVSRLTNDLETAVLLLACMRHGIAICAQPPTAGDDELSDAARTVAADLVLGVGEARLPALDALGGLEPLEPGTVPPRSPFLITFTSGSTGRPKGIVHCAENFIGCADAFNDQTGITRADTFLNAMPMFYMAGIFNGILAPLAAGASVVIADEFSTLSAMHFWPTIEREKITSAWLSPTMLSLVSRLDRGGGKVPSSFERLFIGTGALSAEAADVFYSTYGLAPIQSYGLSELLYISVDDVGSPHFGTVGRPLGPVDITFDDGRLVIDTPYAFLGTIADGELAPYNPPFATSDMGSLSDDGILSILGRMDDVIVRGGVNINPALLERKLGATMEGTAFCIVGMPDPLLGNRVILVSEGDELSGDFQQTVRDTLSTATPIDAFATLDELARGPTGKFRRPDIKAALEKIGAAA